MGRRAASKIIEGLKQALLYAECKHRWSKFEPVPTGYGEEHQTNKRMRICDRCDSRQIKYDIPGARVTQAVPPKQG